MTCFGNGTCSYPSTGTAPQLFSSALQFFAAAQCLVTIVDPPEAHVCDFQCFDYIIVGAGSAGCVLANRLSECKQNTVLLIEAGGNAPIESRIPGLDTSLYGSTFDWKYQTTDDGKCDQALVNGSLSWPRGKMLGGSSSINAMWYSKGMNNDYLEWYKAGNIDWHPNTVQKYFKKLENFQNINVLQNPDVKKLYGSTGPLKINRLNYKYHDVSEKIINSWDEIGIKRVIDLNLPGICKSGIASVTVDKGERQSSDLAYIYPIQNRRNLKIFKHTLVTKILFDDFNRACGVEAEHCGKKLKLCAKLEVILSAGTINSPQLLMLSGIGPKEHLNDKYIDCKVNSPMVGRNLQDQLFIPITIYGKGPCEQDNATKHFDALQYLYNRSGYLAQHGNLLQSSFYSSSSNLTYPEFETFVDLLFKNSSMASSTVGDQLRFKDPIKSSIVNLNKKHALYLFRIVLLHPLSRGNISLQTNNPKDHPMIYPNYLINDKDLDTIVKGIKILTSIVNTKFFKSIDAFLGRMNWAECNKYKLDSVSYWKCISINTVHSINHPIGTCKMGPNPDTSVVDSRLRVHGVTNLRVIDASVMHTLTSGPINGPTIMIGERGADLVKEDHQCSSL